MICACDQEEFRNENSKHLAVGRVVARHNNSITRGSTINVKPTESLSAVREKLAADASITEVIFEKGVYFDGLYVEGPKGADLRAAPAADPLRRRAEVV
jgi:hypothetical protein